MTWHCKALWVRNVTRPNAWPNTYRLVHSGYKTDNRSCHTSHTQRSFGGLCYLGRRTSPWLLSPRGRVLSSADLGRLMLLVCLVERQLWLSWPRVLWLWWSQGAVQGSSQGSSWIPRLLSHHLQRWRPPPWPRSGSWAWLTPVQAPILEPLQHCRPGVVVLCSSKVKDSLLIIRR